MRRRQFQLQTAMLLGLPEGQVDMRTRGLAAAEIDLLKSGPRGVHAAHLTPAEASMIVLSLVSMNARDGAKIAAKASQLQFVPHPEAPNAFFGVDDTRQVTLGAALALALKHSTELTWLRLDVACDGSWANFVVPYNGKPLELMFEVDARKAAELYLADPAKYRSDARYRQGHSYGVAAPMVQLLGSWLADQSAAGDGQPLDCEALTSETIAEMIVRLTAQTVPAAARSRH